jgi:hypothetical protein
MRAAVLVGLCACGRFGFGAHDLGADAPGDARAGYALRKPITISHNKAMGGVDLANFALALKLQMSDLQLATGSDLAFFAGDGTTPLAFELDASTPGELTAWVKLPVLSASVDTQLYVAFSDPNVTTSQEASHTVWSDYAAVWHFSEASYSGVPGEAVDATGMHAGTASGTATTIAGGKLGRAATFTSACDLISIAASPTLQPTSVTVAAWARPADIGVGPDRIDTILAQDTWRAPGTGSQGYYLELYRTVTQPAATFYAADGANIAHAFATNTAQNGVWFHAVGTYDETTGTSTIYVNGAPLGTSTMTGPIAYLLNPVQIGCSFAGGEYWNGDIDEVRISAGARSAGWIATEYANQFDPASFATVGATEPAP